MSVNERTKKQGGSHAGYHFFTTYQDCPRKFFIKYVLRIEKEQTSDALSFGTAIHAAKEHFYKEHPHGLIEDMISTFKGLTSQYNSKDEDQWDRGKRVLTAWYEAFADDERENMEVLSVEEDFIVNVTYPDADEDISFIFTIKPDLVYRDKRTNNVIVRDTKTSSWGIPQVISNFEAQDQCTAYIYGLNKLKPEWKIQQAEVEVLYSRKTVAKAQIGTQVYRTKDELKQFEEGLFSLISELSQKIKNLPFYSEFFLFPRRGKCDGDSGWKCEYREICRQRLNKKYLPLGYARGV